MFKVNIGDNFVNLLTWTWCLFPERSLFHFLCCYHTTLIKVNPFHATCLILHPLKTSENLCFSDVFRWYKDSRSMRWINEERQRHFVADKYFGMLCFVLDYWSKNTVQSICESLSRRQRKVFTFCFTFVAVLLF